MIRSDLKKFYDRDENINETVITLFAVRDKFLSGIYKLKNQIEILCQVYKDSIILNQSEVPQDVENVLQMINDAFSPFKFSVDEIGEHVRSQTIEITQLIPEISHLLHSFENSQKERNYVENKKIMLQSSTAYEQEIATLTQNINELLHSHFVKVNFANSKIDILQEGIDYLNRRNSSSQRSISNPLISDWNVIFVNFENLLKFIENNTEVVENMRSSFNAFSASLNNVHLIKLRELKDVEAQVKEKDILIQHFQKQVSELSSKNSALLNMVETMKKNFAEEKARSESRTDENKIETIDLTDEQENELRDQNKTLTQKVNDLENSHEKLEKALDDEIRKFNDYREESIRQQAQYQESLDEQEKKQKATIDNLQLEHKQEIMKLTKEKEKLAHEMQSLEKLHKEDHETNEDLNKKLDTLRKTINDLHREKDESIENLKDDFEKRKNEMQSELQEVKEELSTITSQLKNSETIRQNLLEKNIDGERKIKKMTEESVRNDLRISRLENRVKTLEQSILTLEDEKQSWNSKEIDLNQKNQVVQNENESLKIQIQDLRNQLSLARAETPTETSSRGAEKSQSTSLLKRKLRSDDESGKRPKPNDVIYWKKRRGELDFTDSHLTATINNIAEMGWSMLQKTIVISSEELIRLQDKLIEEYDSFTKGRKSRNKEKRYPQYLSVMKDLTSKIREQIEIKKKYNSDLEAIILKVNDNYEKDIEQHKTSQSIYMNLLNAIRKDYSDKENAHQEKIRKLISRQAAAKTVTESNDISVSIDKATQMWIKNKDKINADLKEVKERIDECIRRYDQRNGKRKELLFSVQNHFVINIYSEVVNELCISIDKLDTILSSRMEQNT